MDNAELLGLYPSVQSDLIALASQLNADEALAPVPACPGWAVQDVLAHLAGIAADVVADNVAEVGSDPWTDAQVQARRGLPLAAVLDEWQANAPKMLEIAVSWPDFLVNALLGDVVTHAQDIRGALGRPGGRDTAAFKAALEGYVAELGPRLEGEKAPSVRLITQDGDWYADAGRPGASLRLTSFDLFRSLTGRRSARQIAAYGWDGDPQPYLSGWSQYGELSPTDIVEP